MVGGQYYLRKGVKAVHLWPSSERKKLRAFNLTPADINDVRNGLLKIVAACDKQRCCFLYNPLTRRLQLHVVDPALLPTTANPSGHTFAHINGWPLQLPQDVDGAIRWPYRRILSYHARTTIENAVENFGPGAAALLPAVDQLDAFLDLSDRANQPGEELQQLLEQLDEEDELQGDGD